MMKKLHACTMAAVLFAGFGPTLAPAQDAAANYPSQPIKLMVPWPAGGGVDTTARIVSDMLGHRLGHPFVIDNRAGAGGNIGTELAARQKPDGYNLLMSSISPNAVNASLYSKLGFDPVKDFEPVIYVSAVPNILVVPGDSPFKTAKDVIDAARANPGKLNYASGGIGSSQHLAAVQFASAAKIDIVHVPYKGTAPAEADLAAGHVSLMLDTTTCLPFVASGKMRALAVASKKRNPALPDVPTFDEVGLPGVYASSWYGLSAPAGTPKAIIAKLNAEANAVLKSPEFQKRMLAFGAEVGGGTPEEYGRFMASETRRYAEIVRISGVKLD
ncbi:bugT protein [Variovorax paradoxus]|jgi:tripartite-type tricarboxylate transporter receptor subunit TctC|uniref:Bug family tripartite tricarboxylate transporter substrate binding protein n=1 Tax=Variovorax TaxID=34072 RepID=UPI0006E6A6FA|nr:tripartite tricarboxylate transporter substrate binding protein [Variovorax sp. CY25R-8]KPU98170.1 bugT protein [Variovorax paradoxus]KPV03078.1 bugT protein [Variovorax paradoxus]KPV03899.1 bugT protein [Variovorax paradoxus]KPV18738.1 bugT protein [Variovorax paradoxus]KPV29434.1 bugT protein [Variovorax paradoxus]